MKKYVFAVSAFAILLTGCKKDDPTTETPKETTVAEDKANIKASLDGIVACMQTFKSGDFMTSAVNFLGMANGEAANEDWMGEVFDSVFNNQDFEYIENTNRLILANHYGTYSYNKSTKHWDKANDQTDKAVFKFPSSPSETTNNAELVISSYTDTKISQDNEEMYIPATFSVTLSKNGSEIAHLKLNKSTWDVSPEVSVPTAINGSFKLAPFTYTIDLTRPSKTEFKYDVSVSSSTGCSYKSDGTLKLKHSDYANIDGDTDIDNVAINFNYGNFSLNGNVDVDGINALGDNPSVADINSKVDATVNYNGAKIGELEAKEIATDSVDLHIRYKDNTTENVEEVYLKPFAKDLEKVFKDITGEWDIE